MTASTLRTLTVHLKDTTCLTAAALLALAMIHGPVHAGDAKAAQPAMEMQYHQSESAAAGDDDPLEKVNRVTSGFNSLVRELILDPLVSAYKTVTPTDLQTAVSNAANNLSEPVTAVSSLLQGDTENAGNATKRFFVNSIAGAGGMGDPATDAGIVSRKEDLGQAFGANGVEPGAHLVLPILGPSNLRDAAGDVLTSLANPLPLVGKAAQGTVTYSDNQDAIKSVTSNSVDPYTTEKTLYEQHRQFEVTNGKSTAPADGPVLVEEGPSLATKPQ